VSIHLHLIFASCQGCGAEHVQKGRVLPGGVDPAQDQGVRIGAWRAINLGGGAVGADRDGL
jgi:hypothetical protein